MDEYPEHEKLKKISEESQKQGEFLDWLLNESGFVLAEWCGEELSPIYNTPEQLLAEYHGISLEIIEKEKRQMLDEIRKSNS